MTTDSIASQVATPPDAESTSFTRDLLLTLLACSLTTAVAFATRQFLDAANIVMLFLLTVAIVAAKVGQLPGILAAFISVAAFDFFFIPPYFSFTVNNLQYLVTFAVMLAVAILISTLTTGLRHGAESARRRERQTQTLYSLAHALSGVASIDQMLDIIERYFDAHLGRPFQILVPDSTESLKPLGLPHRLLANTELLAARTVYLSGERVESSDLGAEPRLTLILPLRGAIRPRGVLIVTGIAMTDATLKDERQLLEALASLLATTLERLHFVAVAQDSQLETAAERLRSSILSAISHDVRTPLTTMYGLADSLLLDASALPHSARESLETIRGQALRLNHMVTNLLDMARLQTGSVRLKKEWQPIEEVIGASIKLLETTLAGHCLTVKIADDLPLLEFDAVLLERVLCNLLENAAKYATHQGAITIGTEAVDGFAAISIRNVGKGFPSDKLATIFDLFTRGETESSTTGAGMGLAICKAIIEVHGGTITAANEQTGACVTFTLPLGSPPDIAPDPEDSTLQP